MPAYSTLLSWKRPFLPQLVEHLLAGSTSAPYDLASVLVIVPTQQAGRRLRQRLAEAAAERGTGVLSPEIVTPERLVAAENEKDAATASDALAAWVVLLLEVDLGAYEAVFPTLPPRRDASWAAGLGQQLLSLQLQLGEHGLDFSQVAARVAGASFEPERWAALAELELAWRKQLQQRGLVDPTAARLRALGSAQPPDGVERVVLAGVIDPLPLSVQVLQRWAQSMPVEVISHSNPDDPVLDGWGRVDPVRAQGRPLTFPPGTSLRVLRTVKDAAAHVVALARQYAEAPRSLAIGAIDPLALKTLKLAFHTAALPAHDPSGASLGSAGLGLLSLQLLELAAEPDPALVVQILRHPDFAAFAVGTRNWAPTQAELLRQLDHSLNKHLPRDLQGLLRFARDDSSTGLAASVEWLLQLAARYRKETLSAVLRSALAEILGERRFDLSVPPDETAASEGKAVAELLERFSGVEARFSGLARPARVLVLRRALCTARRFPERPENSWDLQGWLELAYEDAPHLALVGLNEGALPETVRGDLFLPNSLREFLGLRGNADRFLRDQILLEAHLRSRADGGRVELIVPRMSDSGDPLQPSRVLFACADDELIQRARKLFAEVPPPGALPARRAAWRLKPLAGRQPLHFSPSTLKAYLQCPYRYYLRNILGMNPVEVGKQELSASTFGDLCHHALETLGRDAKMRDITDAQVLAAYLEDAFAHLAREQLGTVDSFALRVQLESGRARLQAAARVEAVERQQGWRIEHCEHPWKLTLGEVQIKGRIDRIDRNVLTGEYRLIDYKTGETGKPPEQAHWAKYRKAEPHVLPASVFEMHGQTWRWLDLQLPLYLLAIRDSFKTSASAGYFVLPKTREETGLRLWTELTPEHLLHAADCAVAIAQAVSQRRFWPPNLRMRYEDDADYLFPDGIETDVDTDAMLALLRPSAAAE